MIIRFTNQLPSLQDKKIKINMKNHLFRLNEKKNMKMNDL